MFHIEHDILPCIIGFLPCLNIEVFECACYVDIGYSKTEVTSNAVMIMIRFYWICYDFKLFGALYDEWKKLILNM